MTTNLIMDRVLIEDTISRYNIAGDRRDLEAFVGTFCDDAIYESAVFSCSGRDEIRDYLAKAWALAPDAPAPRFRRHNVTTTQIDFIDEENAAGRVYYLMVTDLGLDHCGYYLDRYRRVAERWLFSHRQVWMDWALPESLFVPEASKELVAISGASGPPGGELAD